MQWIAGYQESLGEFGMEEEDVAFPSGPQSGVSLLINKYVDRTMATLSSWLNNIVEVRPGQADSRKGLQQAIDNVMMGWSAVSVACLSAAPPSPGTNICCLPVAG